MRQIRNDPEPADFTEWKKRTPGVGYAQVSAKIGESIKTVLVAAQRSLCAYTGVRIEVGSSHIEHLFPQEHCTAGEALDFTNMAACVPAPGAGYLPYGAVRKDDWPPEAERHLFVSPRSPGCESRFKFNLRGEIFEATAGDQAAGATIEHLGLDHRALTQRRKAAIDATLANLSLKEMRSRLTKLLAAETDNAKLEQFCFVLKQVLAKQIDKIEAIRRSKASKKP
jgi:uncharacterized protein (TIGR02646 family)